VSKVLVADAPHYADQSPENLAALVVAHAQAYGHLLAAATTSGKNFMPRVAALLDVAQISEIVGVAFRRHLRPPDLRRQRHRHRAVGRPGQGDHRPGDGFRSRRRRTVSAPSKVSRPAPIWRRANSSAAN
jgi:hypothetical protein